VVILIKISKKRKFWL